MNTEVKYVVVDLQDEKEICPAFLEEMLVSLDGLEFGSPIAVSRPRNGVVAVEAEAEAEAVD